MRDKEGHITSLAPGIRSISAWLAVSSEMGGWEKFSLASGASAWPVRRETASSRTAASPRDADIVTGGVGEPDAAVGDARAHALA